MWISIFNSIFKTISPLHPPPDSLQVHFTFVTFFFLFANGLQFVFLISKYLIILPIINSFKCQLTVLCHIMFVCNGYGSLKMLEHSYTCSILVWEQFRVWQMQQNSMSMQFTLHSTHNRARYGIVHRYTTNDINNNVFFHSLYKPTHTRTHACMNSLYIFI